MGQPLLNPSDWTWVVAICAIHQVKEVARDAGTLGFFPLLLMERYWKKVRCGGKRIREPADHPLFGGYLIIGLPGDKPEYGALRSIRGVVGRVQAGTAPLHVPPTIIAHLVEQDRAGVWDLTKKGVEKPVMFEGEWVRITEGPFIGLNAVLAKDAFSGKMADILITLFGQYSNSSMPVSWLEKA